MTHREIDNYVKNHEPLVRGILSSIHIKMTKEEKEDASQELFETMIKCLHNYNPNKNTTVTTYVMSSLKKRALNIMRDRFSPQNQLNSTAKSLSTVIHNEDEYVLLEDTIYDECQFEDFVDTKLFIDSVTSKIEPELKYLLESWAGGATITYLAHEAGMSVQSTWSRVKRAINQMQDIAKECGYGEV